MTSVLCLLCSSGITNFKETDKLNNEDDEFKIIDFSGSKIENFLPELIFQHVWTYDEAQNALLNSPFFVIPTKIIHKIFKLLSIGDLRNVLLVCRYFKMIVDQNKKWKIKVQSKLNSESYKQISIDWIYEKYLWNEELKGFEEKYRYMKIASQSKCSSSLQSINNQLVFPMVQFNQHPNSSTKMIIQLSVDLDKTAHELISLLEKTSKFQNKWRKSVILQQMIKRYYRFMMLKNLYPKIYLVPTVDIEIVWQTHLLRPRIYRDDCLRLFHEIIDHSLLLNEIQQSFKQQAFFHTCYLYEKYFNEEYCSLPLYKNAKTSSSKYVHPYFNKLEYLTEIYSYWDKTLFQFSQYSPDGYENPFSFREVDIILDGTWIDSCKYFMNDTLTRALYDLWNFNPFNPVKLKSSEIKRLKKSYERFLYIIKKYSIIKQYHVIHPTYEIDIIWHCHMQEPLNYVNDCINLVGYLIDHYPYSSIKKYQIKQSYKDLNRYWIQEFQNDISTDHQRNS